MTCAEKHRAQGAVAEEQSADAGSGGSGNGAIPPFERIVADFGPLISRIAMSYEADPALREDLTQQILLAVWQALPSFRADASLKTFIARVAQNRSISFVTRQVRQPRLSELPEKLEADTLNPEEEAIELNERETLLAATRRLPLPQREVIILVLEGFSYPEIAQMLDIPPNALALRLSRAKTALKSMLEHK
jgi:RNA polymerase sigma factor (sigma-70 family)